MSVQRGYVGTTPTITDTILDAFDQAVDLTGATVTWVYRPIDNSTPDVSLSATPDPDQSENLGVVRVTLGSPLMDAAADWVWWWHVDFGNGAVLDSDNQVWSVDTHGPGDGSGPVPYMTSGLFRRLTRVKQTRLGIAVGQQFANELLDTEINRAAAYVEFVTGQPATDSTRAVLDTNSGAISDGATGTLLGQAIQMRTEQVTFQAQNGYVDDATNDVVSSFSVGGYSQSKNDQARRGEERQLNSWGALADLLWLLMTLDRYYFWVAFLSGDATLMIAPSYSFENVIQPGWIDGWGYGFGAADILIAETGGLMGIGAGVGLLEGGEGTGGWSGGLGGLPGGILPLDVE